MREDAKPESPAKRASKGPSNAPASAASYFTTDVMGVDLGQGPKEWSSACVAVVEDGEARVVESAQGQRHTPSLVVFQDNGELVGQPALRLLFSRTDTAVHGHQLLLGVPFDSAECEEVARALPLNLTPGPDGNATVLVHGVAHSPADLTARLLALLKGNAENALGGRAVLSAVVGVPVNATPGVRAALAAAGARAGLQQIELLPEPVAAAIAALRHLPEVAAARTLGVYALGGRSFSFSVLRRAEAGAAAPPQPEWQVVAARDERLLGSEAFDEAVVAHLIQTFHATDGIDLSSDNLAMHRLHEAAERAKSELCSEGSTKISLPFISADASGPKHLELTLGRAKFEQLIASHLERTVPVCEGAISAAEMRVADLDAVLLVGGSARAPAVQRLVQRLCGKEPLRLARPEESIALGAAAHAETLQAAQYQTA